MKKIKYILLITMIILVTGCSSTKDVIVTDNLVSTLEDKGYTVYDVTSSYNYSEEAYYVSDTDLTITFIKGNKKYDIQGIFLDECENVYNLVDEDYEKKVKSGKNWATLKVTDSDSYYFVGWIGDSYIKIESVISKENNLDDLVSTLGF